MSIVKESVFGNKHFRSCDVVNHKCKNCGTSYIKKGDWIKTKCYECNLVGIHKVNTVWNDGNFRATCKNCCSSSFVVRILCSSFVIVYFFNTSPCNTSLLHPLHMLGFDKLPLQSGHALLNPVVFALLLTTLQTLT